MTAGNETWEPIEPGALQAGMMIRIDHRWFDHPFIRRFIHLASDKDIATIREAGLTRLFVRHELPAEEPESAEEAETAVPDSMRMQRSAIAQSKKRYRVALDRAAEMFGMINAADPAAAKALGGDIEHIVALLNNSASAPGLLCPMAAPRSQKRLALVGYDAVILTGAIGKRLGLKSAQLRDLAQAAAVHMVGIARLPLNLTEEQGDGLVARDPQFREYPNLSVAILEKCGDFAPEVLRIVAEHRERLDGSGFPRGLRGDAIHPHALLLGAVRELLVRCCAEGVTPAIALAQMHRTAKETWGSNIVNHLVVTLIAHPVGTYVQLSDGRTGRVTHVDKDNYLRPRVMVIEDGSARELGEVDLQKEAGLSILRVLETAQVPGQLETARRSTWSADAPPPTQASGE